MSVGLRLDKWLWQARFAKTRSLAARLIEDGAVRLDGRRVKPAQLMHVGAQVSIRLGHIVHLVEIRALGERRGPATEARALYVALAPAAPEQPVWAPLIGDER